MSSIYPPESPQVLTEKTVETTSSTVVQPAVQPSTQFATVIIAQVPITVPQAQQPNAAATLLAPDLAQANAASIIVPAAEGEPHAHHESFLHRAADSVKHALHIGSPSEASNQPVVLLTGGNAAVGQPVLMMPPGTVADNVAVAQTTETHVADDGGKHKHKHKHRHHHHHHHHGKHSSKNASSSEDEQVQTSTGKVAEAVATGAGIVGTLASVAGKVIKFTGDGNEGPQRNIVERIGDNAAKTAEHATKLAEAEKTGESKVDKAHETTQMIDGIVGMARGGKDANDNYAPGSYTWAPATNEHAQTYQLIRSEDDYLRNHRESLGAKLKRKAKKVFGTKDADTVVSSEEDEVGSDKECQFPEADQPEAQANDGGPDLEALYGGGGKIIIPFATRNSALTGYGTISTLNSEQLYGIDSSRTTTMTTITGLPPAHERTKTKNKKMSSKSSSINDTTRTTTVDYVDARAVPGVADHERVHAENLRERRHIAADERQHQHDAAATTHEHADRRFPPTDVVVPLDVTTFTTTTTTIEPRRDVALLRGDSIPVEVDEGKRRALVIGSNSATIAEELPASDLYALPSTSQNPSSLYDTTVTREVVTTTTARPPSAGGRAYDRDRATPSPTSTTFANRPSTPTLAERMKDKVSNVLHRNRSNSGTRSPSTGSRRGDSLERSATAPTQRGDVTVTETTRTTTVTEQQDRASRSSSSSSFSENEKARENSAVAAAVVDKQTSKKNKKKKHSKKDKKDVAETSSVASGSRTPSLMDRVKSAVTSKKRTSSPSPVRRQDSGAKATTAYDTAAAVVGPAEYEVVDNGLYGVKDVEQSRGKPAASPQPPAAFSRPLSVTRPSPDAPETTTLVQTTETYRVNDNLAGERYGQVLERAPYSDDEEPHNKPLMSRIKDIGKNPSATTHEQRQRDIDEAVSVGNIFGSERQLSSRQISDFDDSDQYRAGRGAPPPQTVVYREEERREVITEAAPAVTVTTNKPSLASRISNAVGEKLQLRNRTPSPAPPAQAVDVEVEREVVVRERRVSVSSSSSSVSTDDAERGVRIRRKKYNAPKAPSGPSFAERMKDAVTSKFHREPTAPLAVVAPQEKREVAYREVVVDDGSAPASMPYDKPYAVVQPSESYRVDDNEPHRQPLTDRIRNAVAPYPTDEERMREIRSTVSINDDMLDDRGRPYVQQASTASYRSNDEPYGAVLERAPYSDDEEPHDTPIMSRIKDATVGRVVTTTHEQRQRDIDNTIPVGNVFGDRQLSTASSEFDEGRATPTRSSPATVYQTTTTQVVRRASRSSSSSSVSTDDAERGVRIRRKKIKQPKPQAAAGPSFMERMKDAVTSKFHREPTAPLAVIDQPQEREVVYREVVMDDSTAPVLMPHDRPYAVVQSSDSYRGDDNEPHRQPLTDRIRNAVAPYPTDEERMREIRTTVSINDDMLDDRGRPYNQQASTASYRSNDEPYGQVLERAPYSDDEEPHDKPIMSRIKDATVGRLGTTTHEQRQRDIDNTIPVGNVFGDRQFSTAGSEFDEGRTTPTRAMPARVYEQDAEDTYYSDERASPPNQGRRVPERMDSSSQYGSATDIYNDGRPYGIVQTDQAYRVDDDEPHAARPPMDRLVSAVSINSDMLSGENRPSPSRYVEDDRRFEESHDVLLENDRRGADNAGNTTPTQKTFASRVADGVRGAVAGVGERLHLTGGVDAAEARPQQRVDSFDDLPRAAATTTTVQRTTVERRVSSSSSVSTDDVETGGRIRRKKYTRKAQAPKLAAVVPLHETELYRDKDIESIAPLRSPRGEWSQQVSTDSTAPVHMPNNKPYALVETSSSYRTDDSEPHRRPLTDRIRDAVAPYPTEEERLREIRSTISINDDMFDGRGRPYSQQTSTASYRTNENEPYGAVMERAPYDDDEEPHNKPLMSRIKDATIGRLGTTTHDQRQRDIDDEVSVGNVFGDRQLSQQLSTTSSEYDEGRATPTPEKTYQATTASTQFVRRASRSSSSSSVSTDDAERGVRIRRKKIKQPKQQAAAGPSFVERMKDAVASKFSREPTAPLALVETPQERQVVYREVVMDDSTAPVLMPHDKPYAVVQSSDMYRGDDIEPHRQPLTDRIRNAVAPYPTDEERMREIRSTVSINDDMLDDRGRPYVQQASTASYRSNDEPYGAVLERAPYSDDEEPHDKPIMSRIKDATVGRVVTTTHEQRQRDIDNTVPVGNVFGDRQLSTASSEFDEGRATPTRSSPATVYQTTTTQLVRRASRSSSSSSVSTDDAERGVRIRRKKIKQPKPQAAAGPSFMERMKDAVTSKFHREPTAPLAVIDQPQEREVVYREVVMDDSTAPVLMPHDRPYAVVQSSDSYRSDDNEPHRQPLTDRIRNAVAPYPTDEERMREIRTTVSINDDMLDDRGRPYNQQASTASYRSNDEPYGQVLERAPYSDDEEPHNKPLMSRIKDATVGRLTGTTHEQRQRDTDDVVSVGNVFGDRQLSQQLSTASSEFDEGRRTPTMQRPKSPVILDSEHAAIFNAKENRATPATVVYTETRREEPAGPSLASRISDSVKGAVANVGEKLHLTGSAEQHPTDRDQTVVMRKDDDDFEKLPPSPPRDVRQTTTTIVRTDSTAPVLLPYDKPYGVVQTSESYRVDDDEPHRRPLGERIRDAITPSKPTEEERMREIQSTISINKNDFSGERRREYESDEDDAGRRTPTAKVYDVERFETVTTEKRPMFPVSVTSREELGREQVTPKTGPSLASRITDSVKDVVANVGEKLHLTGAAEKHPEDRDETVMRKQRTINVERQRSSSSSSVSTDDVETGGRIRRKKYRKNKKQFGNEIGTHSQPVVGVMLGPEDESLYRVKDIETTSPLPQQQRDSPVVVRDDEFDAEVVRRPTPPVANVIEKVTEENWCGTERLNREQPVEQVPEVIWCGTERLNRERPAEQIVESTTYERVEQPKPIVFAGDASPSVKKTITTFERRERVVIPLSSDRAAPFTVERRNFDETAREVAPVVQTGNVKQRMAAFEGRQPFEQHERRGSSTSSSTSSNEPPLETKITKETTVVKRDSRQPRAADAYLASLASKTPPTAIARPIFAPKEVLIERETVVERKLPDEMQPLSALPSHVRSLQRPVSRDLTVVQKEQRQELVRPSPRDIMVDRQMSTMSHDIPVDYLQQQERERYVAPPVQKSDIMVERSMSTMSRDVDVEHLPQEDRQRYVQEVKKSNIPVERQISTLSQDIQVDHLQPRVALQALKKKEIEVERQMSTESRDIQVDRLRQRERYVPEAVKKSEILVERSMSSMPRDVQVERLEQQERERYVPDEQEIKQKRIITTAFEAEKPKEVVVDRERVVEQKLPETVQTVTTVVKQTTETTVVIPLVPQETRPEPVISAGRTVSEKSKLFGGTAKSTPTAVATRVPSEVVVDREAVTRREYADDSDRYAVVAPARVDARVEQTYEKPSRHSSASKAKPAAVEELEVYREAVIERKIPDSVQQTQQFVAASPKPHRHRSHERQQHPVAQVSPYVEQHERSVSPRAHPGGVASVVQRFEKHRVSSTERPPSEQPVNSGTSVKHRAGIFGGSHNKKPTQITSSTNHTTTTWYDAPENDTNAAASAAPAVASRRASSEAGRNRPVHLRTFEHLPPIKPAHHNSVGSATSGPSAGSLQGSTLVTKEQQRTQQQQQPVYAATSTEQRSSRRGPITVEGVTLGGARRLSNDMGAGDSGASTAKYMSKVSVGPLTPVSPATPITTTTLITTPRGVTPPPEHVVSHRHAVAVAAGVERPSARDHNRLVENAEMHKPVYDRETGQVRQVPLHHGAPPVDLGSSNVIVDNAALGDGASMIDSPRTASVGRRSTNDGDQQYRETSFDYPSSPTGRKSADQYSTMTGGDTTFRRNLHRDDERAAHTEYRVVSRDHSATRTGRVADLVAQPPRRHYRNVPEREQELYSHRPSSANSNRSYKQRSTSTSTNRAVSDKNSNDFLYYSYSKKHQGEEHRGRASSQFGRNGVDNSNNNADAHSVSSWNTTKSPFQGASHRVRSVDRFFRTGRLGAAANSDINTQQSYDQQKRPVPDFHVPRQQPQQTEDSPARRARAGRPENIVDNGRPHVESESHQKSFYNPSHIQTQKPKERDIKLLVQRYEPSPATVMSVQRNNYRQAAAADEQPIVTRTVTEQYEYNVRRNVTGVRSTTASSGASPASQRPLQTNFSTYRNDLALNGQPLYAAEQRVPYVPPLSEQHHISSYQAGHLATKTPSPTHDERQYIARHGTVDTSNHEYRTPSSSGRRSAAATPTTTYLRQDERGEKRLHTDFSSNAYGDGHVSPNSYGRSTPTGTGRSHSARPGWTRFTWAHQGAQNVRITGDFTDWNTHGIALHPQSDGTFENDLELAPGIYEYQYIVDGRAVHDPDREYRYKYSGAHNVMVVQ